MDISKTRGGKLSYTFATAGIPTYVTTAGTIKIMDNTGTSGYATTPITAGTITYGATTTLSAGATAGKTTLRCVSASGFNRGDVVVIGPNSSGQIEANRVEFVASTANQIQLLRELKYSYAASAAVECPTLTYQLTSTAAGEFSHQWNAIAEWTFDYNSHTHKEFVYFNIVPQVFVPAITSDDLILEDRLLQKIDREDLQQCVDAAWQEIEFVIRTRGKHPALVLDNGLLDYPHKLLSAAKAYRLMRKSPDDIWENKAREAQDEGRTALMSALNQAHYDSGRDRVIGDAESGRSIGIKRFSQ